MLYIRNATPEQICEKLKGHVAKNVASRIAYIYRHKSNPKLTAYCYRERQDAVMADMNFVFQETIIAPGRLGAQLQIVG